MSLGNTFENDLAKLIFNGVAIANIADNAATSPLTDLYISLHTADPGEGGSQTTSEISYTGYARIPVERSTDGWTVSGAVVSPAAPITFGAMTAGAGGTVSYFAIGTASSGAGKILVVSDVLATPIPVSVPIQPIIGTGTTITFN